jgi:hypothetical protein
VLVAAVVVRFPRPAEDVVSGGVLARTAASPLRR